MPAQLGSRPMTRAEIQKRYRARKFLRERAAAAPLEHYVLAGLDGSDEAAREDIAEFLAGLPGELADIRAELGALREERAARETTSPAGARRGLRQQRSGTHDAHSRGCGVDDRY